MDKIYIHTKYHVFVVVEYCCLFRQDLYDQECFGPRTFNTPGYSNSSILLYDDVYLSAHSGARNKHLKKNGKTSSIREWNVTKPPKLHARHPWAYSQQNKLLVYRTTKHVL